MNSSTDTVAHTLRPTRDVLDRLRIEEFVWLPYTDDSPEMAEWHSGMELGRACVPLIWYHIVEYQYPDRVMRQFGLVQTYPPRDPIRVQVHLHALHRQGNSTMNWRQRQSAFVAQWDSRGEHMVQMGVQYLDPDRRVQLGYFEWYHARTNVLLSDPNCCQSQGYHASQQEYRNYANDERRESEDVAREDSDMAHDKQAHEPPPHRSHSLSH